MENKYPCKERSNNFSRDEILKLRKLLQKYNSILSNKKTDHLSNKNKEEAWSKLTNEFNANNSVYRTRKQIIYKFTNMKKSARKELSQEKKGNHIADDGLLLPKPDNREWLCNIMSESIVGLPSTFDSDFTEVTDKENKERKLSVTSVEPEINTTMASEKENFIKKKIIREDRILEFADEEHRKDMEYKEEIHKMEVEFKRKLHEILLKKATVELQIEEEKLNRIKNSYFTN